MPDCGLVCLTEFHTDTVLCRFFKQVFNCHPGGLQIFQVVRFGFGHFAYKNLSSGLGLKNLERNDRYLNFLSGQIFNHPVESGILSGPDDIYLNLSFLIGRVISSDALFKDFFEIFSLSEFLKIIAHLIGELGEGHFFDARGIVDSLSDSFAAHHTFFYLNQDPSPLMVQCKQIKRTSLDVYLSPDYFEAAQEKRRVVFNPIFEVLFQGHIPRTQSLRAIVTNLPKPDLLQEFIQSEMEIFWRNN